MGGARALADADHRVVEDAPPAPDPVREAYDTMPLTETAAAIPAAVGDRDELLTPFVRDIVAGLRGRTRRAPRSRDPTGRRRALRVAGPPRGSSRAAICRRGCMVPAGGSARARLLRRHTGDVRRLCVLALGSPAEAAAATAAAIDRAATALRAGRRPEDGRTWLLAIAVGECARRTVAARRDEAASPEHTNDAWEAVRRLPAAQRAALILHEGVGLGIRPTARSLGIDWRAATDLLFSARRTLAQAAGGAEPLECTAHRRRLSDAGCRGGVPVRSRGHLKTCEGCRGMLRASAERRGLARAVPRTAPADAERALARTSPRRLVGLAGRPALAAAAGLTAIAVGGLVLSGGGAPPAPAPPATAGAADAVAAVAGVPPTATPAMARPAARRAQPVRRRHRAPAPRPRADATGGASIAVTGPAVTGPPAAPAPAALTGDVPDRTRRLRQPAVPSPRPGVAPGRGGPSRPAPASPPRDPPAAAPSAPAPTPAPTTPAPADSAPVAAGEPSAPTPPDPGTTTPSEPVTAPPDPGAPAAGTTP
jgi:DNA-directed RNA polymerase specialized sigma24 family protein